MTIAVDVNAVQVSWLHSLLPGVRVVDRRPADLETVLPVVVVRRGGGGDRAVAVDGPILDVDCYAAGRDAAVALALRVDQLYREQTPVGWMGCQFTFLRCSQAPLIVSDANQAVAHVASSYSLSLS